MCPDGFVFVSPGPFGGYNNHKQFFLPSPNDGFDSICLISVSVVYTEGVTASLIGSYAPEFKYGQQRLSVA